MKKEFRVISLIVAMLMIMLSGCNQQPTYTEGPAIWKVTDPDTKSTLYLFGSIHVADDTAYPLNETITTAYEESDALAVEVDIKAFADDTEAQAAFSADLMYTDGGTITDEIDESLIEQLEEVLDGSEALEGVPMEYLRYMRPYMWLSLMNELSFEKSGLSAEKGIDMHFLELAHEEGKEILEVESMESQMDMLMNFSPEIQSYQLEGVADIDATAEELTELYTAWKAGDLEGYIAASEDESKIQELSEDERAAMEDYELQMITERNILMADAAESYMKDGKNVFFVVGALHMVDDGGIVELLADKGYKVTRI